MTNMPFSSELETKLLSREIQITPQGITFGALYLTWEQVNNLRREQVESALRKPYLAGSEILASSGATSGPVV